MRQTDSEGRNTGKGGVGEMKGVVVVKEGAKV